MTFIRKSDIVQREVIGDGKRSGRKLVIYRQANGLWRYFIVSAYDKILRTGTATNKSMVQLKGEVHWRMK
jgi:hypothetical protein